MSDLNNMLGEEITDSQLRGEQDEGAIQPATEISENKEDANANANANAKVQDKAEVDFKAKFEEEKGYRTRLLSENKEFKAELRELRALKQEFEEFKVNKEKLKTEESIPDPKEDPIGYLQNTLMMLRSDIEGLKKERTTQVATNEEFIKAQEVVKILQKSSIAYKENNPDFEHAVKYLSDARTKELQAYGYDDDKIEQIINYDVYQLAQNAINRELNPSELLYSLAKIKGFVSKEEVKKGFDKVEKGAKRSKSLSEVGDTSSQISENPSLSDLLNATDEDFDRHWDKVMKVKA